MGSNDALVFSTMAKYFSPTTESDWVEATCPSAWASFLDGVRQLLQDDAGLGQATTPAHHMHARKPLQTFLANDEVNALFTPPTFAEKQAFAAKHLIGGLPVSAVPVESLYVQWTSKPNATTFAQKEGLYISDAALYMQALLDRMGFEVPEEFASYPDHLSIELELLSALIDEGLVEEARMFLIERFAWLTTYRLQLVGLGKEALFALALVDAILGIRAQQANRA